MEKKEKEKKIKKENVIKEEDEEKEEKEEKDENEIDTKETNINDNIINDIYNIDNNNNTEDNNDILMKGGEEDDDSIASSGRDSMRMFNDKDELQGVNNNNYKSFGKIFSNIKNKIKNNFLDKV